jgi:outer membrane murein-binding lipoprotein Lpp
MKTTSKFATVCLAACLLVGLAGTIVMQHTAINRLRQENNSLQQQVERLTARSDQFAAGKEQLSKVIVEQPANACSSPVQQPSSEVLRLRGEVGRMRVEVKDAEDSRRAEMQAAQSKIADAETNLTRLTKLHSQQLVSEQELSHAQFAVQLLKAEANGDKPLAAQIRLQEAEQDLARATELRKQSLISQSEYDDAARKVASLRTGTN